MTKTILFQILTIEDERRKEWRQREELWNQSDGRSQDEFSVLSKNIDYQTTTVSSSQPEERILLGS